MSTVYLDTNNSKIIITNVTLEIYKCPCSVRIFIVKQEQVSDLHCWRDGQVNIGLHLRQTFTSKHQCWPIMHYLILHYNNVIHFW